MFLFMKNFFVGPVNITSEVIPGSKRDEERAKMFSLQQYSSKEIWIVAGELDPEFYNKDYAEMIRKKFTESPNFRLNILFSKDDTMSIDERIKLVYHQNQELCELLKDGAFEGRLSLFLIKKRPVNHFGIVDNSILIEKIHEPNKERDVLIVKNYQTLVEKYKRYFIKLIHDNSDVCRLRFSQFTKFKNIA